MSHTPMHTSPNTNTDSIQYLYLVQDAAKRMECSLDLLLEAIARKAAPDLQFEGKSYIPEEFISRVLSTKWLTLVEAAKLGKISLDTVRYNMHKLNPKDTNNLFGYAQVAEYAVWKLTRKGYVALSKEKPSPRGQEESPLSG